ncbi:hypothetical protein DM02DRAFT_640170 [Periconia macrospinosa]|uniref:Zn(2)-C6 fungal-type domain-containing protein n=1 Tax=Periconia macrospinosa TaxID=97972 RepID=A0A2V1E4H5_9PLEO|nr:hypothetical protein DM02DRAFT_640170 [Periconia macrospinosa]
MPAVKGTRRTDPVCGTCRKKSRKCDRTRPQCKRCIKHGLVCEGYQLNIQMYNMKNGALRKTRSITKDKHHQSSTTDTLAIMTPPSTTDAPSTTDGTDLTAARSPVTNEVCNATSTATPSATSLQLADMERERELLTHYLWICQSSPNPFETYILPLAHEHPGLMNAVLGLTACHISKPGILPRHYLFNSVIEYRLAAIQSLSALLVKEEQFGLNDMEEEIALAIVLMLVFQDLWDCGRSPQGAHLNGVTFLCDRLANPTRSLNRNRLFLVTALTWFDVSRGFSGPEKLAFPSSIRQFVAAEGGHILTALFGCPVEIFIALDEILTAGKRFWMKELDSHSFQALLDPVIAHLETWNPQLSRYPDDDPAWPLLAEAFRHTVLLRALRFPDSLKIPCTDPRIKASVNAILDISASMSRNSPYVKRLLFPLFVAGAETESPHQQQYALMCLENIRDLEGMSCRRSVFVLLRQTWEERKKSDGTKNVPWFQFTCSEDLIRQHDYLFF